MITLPDPWFTVKQIARNTYAISEYGHWEKVHSFLLVGDTAAILIDTGLGIDNLKRITDQLTNLPITVVTTHVHWDHIGSHAQYEEIYVHALEADWLINGIKGLSITQIRHDIARDITLPTPKTFQPEAFIPFQGTPTKLLQDGDIIDIGNRKIQIIHTPGHSPGHICIYDYETAFLFTGDLLYEGTIFAFYPSTNPVDLVQSLKKIINFSPIKQIYGSHHTLGLPPTILKELKYAIQYLSDNNLVHHGTGTHSFQNFSIQF
ncbi:MULTISPECIES: MBL fold metallo-hydrolase [Bacillus]|uniref:MBL fold metallo-hydrolase n=1 Tax=Bacillus TaxID=1386 RepID=UPI000534B19E|nr:MULTISPECIES: MBL fold metallo-hydrolase [Bacillus]PER33108.1 MBL fold metallo-hydrolase [Bacillus cereus]AYF09464.1 MBL fold metallo-hydrolase [Bacillus mobilis]MED0949823.1 MBL fold metallo-hydrolase [Bacillus mobilis]MED0997034.1 MBL fold metallo-hydrolase [Bacillus mobilis]MED1001490.1 MBL fold metallo-hydrolase [Bacillus mobilis]